MDETHYKWIARIAIPLAIVGWVLAIAGLVELKGATARLDAATEQNRAITDTLERVEYQLARGEEESARARALATELASTLDDLAIGSGEIGQLIAAIADDVRRIIARLSPD